MTARCGDRYVAALEHNIEVTRALFASGDPPALVGTVSGSATAREFWQSRLERARADFGARSVVSLHEDLPVNQAFGLLLCWQRIRPRMIDGGGALIAFVFGEGSRASPFTEAESGQKPALSTYVAVGRGPDKRYLSVVELALRYFAPVESYLRRSGFDGIVVKWGDEVQIPTRDLSGVDPSLSGADVVRFVSLRRMTADDAANKDWVGVDSAGRVTTFIPRRPLDAMRPLAERGWLERRGGEIFGGVNLGSIALSRVLLDALLEEFSVEVNDPRAKRSQRPDLDPQLFTALTIAAIDDPAERSAAWALAKRESATVARLEAHLPGILERLRGVIERFEARHGRKVRLVALDFCDQYWGDAGQHRQLYELYMALGDEGPAGTVARALAGLSGARDGNGNWAVGETRLGPSVRVHNSVLIDVRVESGEIESSVLIGTRAGTLRAREAFDVESAAVELELERRAGSYKLVSETPLRLGPGERATSVFLPDRELVLRVHEDTDLRDRERNYASPIGANALSFADVHAGVLTAEPVACEARRNARRQEVEAEIARRWP